MRVLILAAALAVPASWVTNESFRPIDARLDLETGRPSATFSVPDRAPLFLEYTLTVRAPGDPRAIATVQLNGAPAGTIAIAQSYAPVQGKILLDFSPVRTGENLLAIAIDGAQERAFEVRARIQNYYGIAPDFPRVFVVSDETVAAASSQRSFLRRALRFGAFYLASLMALIGVSRLHRWSPGSRVSKRSPGSLDPGSLLLLSPSIVLWVALAYSLLTPQHIWLSIDAALVAAGAGLAIGAAAIWMVAHRRGVLRIAAVTTVTLLSLEIALRVFNHFSPSFIFYADGYDRYRGQPGAPFFDTRFNSRGFNDVEHALDKPAIVTRRILAIGDSFAVGVVPYLENYLTRLESELASDGSTEVVKMGVAATEPRDYLAILVKEGLAFKPDLVLVSVFIGNDFEAPGRRPYEYSYAATLVRAAWRMARTGKPATAATDATRIQYKDDEPSVTRERFLEIEVDRAWVYDKASSVLPSAVTAVAGQLRDMRDLTARAGANFAVVLIPDEAQVNAALQAEVVRASGLGADRIDFDHPNRLVAAALAGDRIPVLDLLPVFREQGREQRLYKPRDTHWNIAGNRLAATTIAAFCNRRPGP